MPSALDAFLQAVSGAVAATLTAANLAPTAVVLTNTVTAINENTATTSPLKIADIVVADDALGINTLSLTGADAAFFEIVGTSLYLKAGTVLDYEAKTGYSFAVRVDDTSVGTTPDATSAAYTLAVGNVVDTALEALLVAIGGVIGGAITPVNLPPTAMVLTNTVASIDENTPTVSHIKVADIAVIDDALGINMLSLAGADAAFFEIVGTSLYLKAGTVLDAGNKASYAVVVTADDPDKGSNPDASAIYALSVVDVNAAPVAQSGAAGGNQDTPINGVLIATDVDNTAAQLTYSRVADSAHGTVSVNADGTFSYAPVADYVGSDSFTFKVSDGVADSNVATIWLTIAAVDDAPVIGTPGNDSYDALPGRERIDAGGGIDTIMFGFKLADATIKYESDKVIVDGPGGSHTVLTGFEVFNFTDGTVNNADGKLVDDLYYYANNHDVWNAKVDADAHYDQFGWHEGRNPNAFFDTTGYLDTYTDVKNANVNPLTHYDVFGWKEGRDPSTAFDTGDYFSANADVAAAKVDPLAHFLLFGHQEGRHAFNDGAWG